MRWLRWRQAVDKATATGEIVQAQERLHERDREEVERQLAVVEARLRVLRTQQRKAG